MAEPVGVAEYEFTDVGRGDAAVFRKADGTYVPVLVTSVKRDAEYFETLAYEVCTYTGHGRRSEDDFHWVGPEQHVRVYASFGDAGQYADHLNDQAKHAAWADTAARLDLLKGE
jgi:hypothetical protein